MVRNSAQQIRCYQLRDWASRPGSSWASGPRLTQPTISHAGKESSHARGATWQQWAAGSGKLLASGGATLGNANAALGKEKPKEESKRKEKEEEKEKRREKKK